MQRNTIGCPGRDRLAFARIDQSGEAFFMTVCEMGKLLMKVHVLYRLKKGSWLWTLWNWGYFRSGRMDISLFVLIFGVALEADNTRCHYAY